MNTVMEAALEYVSMGYCVIPIKPDYNEEAKKFDKKPYIKWEKYQTTLSTQLEVEQWWTKWPNAMIGILTGAISKTSVIDCDSPEAYQYIQDQLPDSYLAPIATTPRGGKHLWYLSNGTRIINKANIIPHLMPKIDSRGDGGYIVAPPSVNEHGQKYEWLSGLSLREVAPQGLPEALLNNFKEGGIIRGGKQTSGNFSTLQSQQIEQFLQEGTRDQDVFHVMHCLAKGGFEKELAYKIADIICESCLPPFEKSEGKGKVDSAYGRQEKVKRNLMAEIRGYVSLHGPNIFLTEAYETLQIQHSEEKANAQVCFHRLETVEKVLTKIARGHYRKVQPSVLTKFIDTPFEEFPVILPIGINRQCKLFAKNIVIIAGTKGAGKTAFMMKVALENQSLIPVVYLNSEMGDEEYSDRMKKLGITRQEDILFQTIECHSNFQDHITEDRKIFIIDFLEIHKDFYAVAEYIRAIHEKLKEGIAIIGIQKKQDATHGRGGEFSIEKARLALNLDYRKDEKCTRVTILDAKNPKRSDVKFAYRDVKIINGTSLSPIGDWEYPHGD